MPEKEDANVMPPPEDRVDNATQSDTASTADTLDALRKQLDEARSQADELLDKYRRSGAEFANYRKRQERDREQQEIELRRRIFTKLLPIAEDFRRALLHVPEDIVDLPWVQGVALIANKMNALFGEFQVQPIDAVGKPFDPAYHQALMREASGQYPAETVIEELEKGYMIGNQVLKPSLVKVSSGPEMA